MRPAHRLRRISTHTHRGHRPVGGNKYIATSWILYQRAEMLFAQP